MALVAMNDITTGLRGKFGKQFVFRIIRGKTFVSRYARKPDKAKETAAQRSTRDNFRRASAWAKEILSDPEKKKNYLKLAQELSLPNAYTAAIKEYMGRKHQFQVSGDSYFRSPVVDSQTRRRVPTALCSLKAADSEGKSEQRSMPAPTHAPEVMPISDFIQFQISNKTTLLRPT